MKKSEDSQSAPNALSGKLVSANAVEIWCGLMIHMEMTTPPYVHHATITIMSDAVAVTLCSMKMTRIISMVTAIVATVTMTRLTKTVQYMIMVSSPILYFTEMIRTDISA